MVIFTPEAQEQLAALYRYIAAAASPDIAERYTPYFDGSFWEPFLLPAPCAYISRRKWRYRLVV